MWMKTYTQCDPTINNRDSIMSKDKEFMTKEIIKTLCNCPNKAFCLHIDDLLRNWHRPEVTSLLENYDYHGSQM